MDISEPFEPSPPHRLLLIVGHPRSNSLSAALAKAYAEGAIHADAAIRTLALADMTFAPDVSAAPISAQPLEPGITEAQRLISWASHIVLFYPTWWGTCPARLKGFLDRTLTPGFAFAENDAAPTGFEGLLSGRTAHLVTTMDTPLWVYRWIYGRPGSNALARATLGFCGIAPVRVTAFSPVRRSTPELRADWLARIAAEGARLRGAVPTQRESFVRKSGAWLRAIRLQFYPMTWLAYTIGALHAAGSDAFGSASYWFGYLCLFLIEFVTVQINELVDVESDRANRNPGPFNGGSRVLVDGMLSRAELRIGVAVAGGFALLAAAALFAHVSSMLASLTILGPLAILALGYAAPPLKLSYRGLGEIDVALTHGAGVLLAGHVFLGGALDDPVPWLVALPVTLAVLPSITLSGLPDRSADSSAGKRTLAVRFGDRGATLIAVAFTFLSAALAIIWDARGVANGLFEGAAIFVVIHGMALASLLIRRLLRPVREARIDGLMVVALTYLIWFAAIPFIHLI